MELASAAKSTPVFGPDSTCLSTCSSISSSAAASNRLEIPPESMASMGPADGPRHMKYDRGPSESRHRGIVLGMRASLGNGAARNGRAAIPHLIF